MTDLYSFIKILTAQRLRNAAYLSISECTILSGMLLKITVFHCLCRWQTS